MQSKLGDFDVGGQSSLASTETEQPEPTGPRVGGLETILSDDATMEGGSCPWCLHPEEEMTRDLSSSDSIGCPNCDSRIPEEAEWYQNGEKIIL